MTDTTTTTSNVNRDATQVGGRELMVEMASVDKFFGTFQALSNIDMKVGTGEVVVVIGPSGSGKSTLIRCINRLEHHDRGRIVVDGVELTDDVRNIALIRRETGMVFQQFNLFPHLTVIDNITLGPRQVLKMPKKQAEDRAMELLERVKIPEQARKFPGQLSGGQQQRVAIARSLAMQPKIMLFDEPTSALDPEMISEVLEVILEFQNWHDPDRGHPRDGFRPRGRRPGHLHGRRRDRRSGRARALLHQPPRRAHPALPVPDPLAPCVAGSESEAERVFVVFL